MSEQLPQSKASHNSNFGVGKKFSHGTICSSAIVHILRRGEKKRLSLKLSVTTRESSGLDSSLFFFFFLSNKGLGYQDRWTSLE